MNAVSEYVEAVAVVPDGTRRMFMRRIIGAAGRGERDSAVPGSGRMPPRFDLQGHVALITGANHGIGAATALTLASCGAAVVVSYLRIQDPGDIGGPDVYRRNREMTADHVVTTVARQGGRAIAIEADLTDAGSPARLFDAG